ncbi:uncharacterized protein LOC121955281 isoform X2 [Plectropomus leopardus]|uniref:uncharacterized protein LOC121955281 isoform X2 n=1 Tax=Plectropomus leopardus TaxID=160734 RepID=UPI001C4D825E|nr:uncharacterized protein LOC121955281 isoform X2 [Plectropomus leopardus]
MSGFRWIQMLSTLLLLTAINGQYLAFVVRDEDDVTLPCENMTQNQNECENVNWLFSGAGNTPSVELVQLGRIGETSKSDRLSVTEKCSLGIKNITGEDVGRYSCRQHGEDAHVYLSVVNMEESKSNDKVTLSCSVSTYGWCTQRLQWLFSSKDIRDVKTSQSYCSASLTFIASHDNDTSSYGSFTCQATDIFTGKVKQFTFSDQSSGEDATSSPQDWWRFIIVSVGIAGLVITVLTVRIWTNIKENKTQMDAKMVRNDEDNGRVIYENLGDLYASVRLH